jgi:hypothetical protein
MITKLAFLSLSNAALYLITCAVIGTGLLLELRMDEEDGALRFLGMGRDDWGEVHFVIAIGFAGLIVLHLLLNWAWIKAARVKAKWTAPLLAAGLALVAVMLLWPTGQKPVSGDNKAKHHQRDDD